MNKKEPVRLNRFLYQAGVASRRKADKLIEQGRISVNKEVVQKMGFKVQKNDKVFFDG